MSSTGGGIVVRYQKIKILGTEIDLLALANTTNDEELKAEIIKAIDSSSDE